MSAGDVRALLERHGLAAHKDRGQNFLVDDELAKRLVELSGVEPGDGVLEIGTGLGIMTRALVARGARVITIEVDAGLVRLLSQESLLPEGVVLVHGDALRVDLAEQLGALGAPARVVANLPYSISAPVLRRLLDLRDRLVDWSVMLQRDVADRLMARPGTREYGSLTVLHGLCVDIERAMELGGGCFYPPPRVRSTFLRMRPKADAPSAEELSRVERVARAAFATRRKTLSNALRAAGIDGGSAAALEALGIDPRNRAERLAPESFRSLALALAAAR
jgi:16S rRNA (adenine1518-N6/adenine1519-N6)-dimethyltransferase